ncbi:hypothetical protein Tco_1131622, partial [Tanacetum coccineum]
FIMDLIPSSIIFDIFSRVPARCLARSREFKKGPFLEFLSKRPLSKYSIVRIKVRGSCNGLICLSKDDGHLITSLVVIHPLRKEWYELPPFPLCFEKHMHRESSCGLGFDAFTNTWKMVCVLLKEYAPPDKPDMVKKNLCTMVHVFGTNSWREIPQVPSYPISGKPYLLMAVCIGWPVILTKKPKMVEDRCGYQVVDLNGEVGYVCTRTMEVWFLNHKKKEWVSHCRFKEEIVPDGYIDVIGCWNKDGDILIKSFGGNPMSKVTGNAHSAAFRISDLSSPNAIWAYNLNCRSHPECLNSYMNVRSHHTYVPKTLF